jgi:hypothetical protein
VVVGGCGVGVSVGAGDVAVGAGGVADDAGGALPFGAADGEAGDFVPGVRAGGGDEVAVGPIVGTVIGCSVGTGVRSGNGVGPGAGVG